MKEMREICALFGEMNKFLTALRKAGFDLGLIQEIINSKDNELAIKMYKAIVQPIIQPPSHGVIFDFFVDYTRTVEEMVVAGKFDSANRNVNSLHFPIPANKKGKKEKISTKLLNFGRQLSIDDAAERIRKVVGFRSATVHEILAFAEHNPNLQRKFTILALGSVWTSGLEDNMVILSNYDPQPTYQHTVYPSSSSSKRGLGFMDFNGYASENCCFLLVKDQPED